jgi:chemotaxis signal transduction protein
MSLASYVLFPLGQKRFALPSEAVAELARPDRLHSFPHTTPWLTGVLYRRGRMVPVCDVGQVLVGSSAPARRFYLIVQPSSAGESEWTAIPVTGECELIKSEAKPPVGNLPVWVTGLLPLSELVEVLNLKDLLAIGMAEVPA